MASSLELPPPAPTGLVRAAYGFVPAHAIAVKDPPESRPTPCDASREMFARVIVELLDDLGGYVARQISTALQPGFGPSDVAQSVLADMVPDFSKILGRSPAELRAHVLERVRNKLKVYARRYRAQKRDRRREVALDDAFGGGEASHEGASDHAELLVGLHKAVNQLPKGQRDVIVRGVLLQKTHREIARELGISTGASRKKLQRGIENLAEMLGSEDD